MVGAGEAVVGVRAGLCCASLAKELGRGLGEVRHGVREHVQVDVGIDPATGESMCKWMSR